MEKATRLVEKVRKEKVAVHRGRANSSMRIGVHAVVVAVVVARMGRSVMDLSVPNQVDFREVLVRRTTIVETAGEGTVVAETVVEGIPGEMMVAAAAEVAPAAVVTASSRVVVADVIRDAAVIPAGFVAAARFSLQRK
jgi:hypothetical protein